MKKIQVLLGICLVSVSVSSIYSMDRDWRRPYEERVPVHKEFPVLKTALSAAAIVGLWLLWKGYDTYADCSLIGELFNTGQCYLNDSRACAMVKVCPAFCQDNDFMCFLAKVTSIIAPDYMNEYMDQYIADNQQDILRGFLHKIKSLLK